MADAEPIFDEVAAPPPAKTVGDPSAMVVRGRWFYPVTVLVPLLLFAAGYGLALQSLAGWLTFALAGSLIGVMMTMIAMAWGAAMAFTEGTRTGLLFTMFPPYMPYFAATRWRSMAQPSILFLAGLGLAAATLWTAQRMVPPPPVTSGYEAADNKWEFNAVIRTQMQPLTVVWSS